MTGTEAVLSHLPMLMQPASNDYLTLGNAAETLSTSDQSACAWREYAAWHVQLTKKLLTLHHLHTCHHLAVMWEADAAPNDSLLTAPNWISLLTSFPMFAGTFKTYLGGQGGWKQALMKCSTAAEALAAAKQLHRVDCICWVEIRSADAGRLCPSCLVMHTRSRLTENGLDKSLDMLLVGHELPGLGPKAAHMQ